MTAAILCKTTNNTDETKTASVELHMTDIQPTALEGEKTVTVEPSKPQWFAYTVPTTGRYIFTATTGEQFDTNYTNVKYYDSMTLETDYGTYDEKWLKKDKVIYIRVDNTTAANASVKLTAKRIVGEAVTAGTAKEVALKKGETKWYQFTADADEYYSFDVKNADDMYTNWYYYVPNNNGTYSGTKELKAGDTVLVKMTRNDSAEAESLTAKLTITKRTYTTLKEKEDLTIKTRNGEYEYIEFTAPKAGYYEFYVKDVPKDVTVASDQISSGYIVKKLSIAEKFRFYVGASFTSANADDTKKFKLYASEVTPTELTSKANVTVAKNQKAWFTFTAPDDGRYVFSDNSADVVVSSTVNKKKSGSDSYYNVRNENTPFEYSMLEGNTIYVSVAYSDKKTTSTATETPASASFKVSVAKIEPTAITTAETSVELAAGASKWYSYIAAKSGGYKFDIDTGDLTLYTSMASDRTKSNPAVLVAGETVYVKITNNSNETKTAKVTVASTEATALALDTELEVGFTDEEIAAGTITKYLAFKAPKTGYYKFTKTEGTLIPYIVDRGYDLNTSQDNIFIKEGATVFVEITSNSVATVKIKVENGTTEFSYETIAVDQQKLIELEAGEKRYLEFTAPSNGTYRFFSTNVTSSDYHDSLAYLYDDTMKRLDDDDDSGEGDNFKIDDELVKGQTVYLMVRAYDNRRPISFNVFVKEVK